MIAVGRDEDLSLVAQAAERDRMYDAIAVALEGVARAAGDVGPLYVAAAAAQRRIAGIRGEAAQRTLTLSRSC